MSNAPSSATRLAVLLACLSFIPLPAASGASGGPSSPLPIVVQGVVEVINDVLRTPYNRVASLPSDSHPLVGFDVPDGKRLVVETLTFQASQPAAATPRRMFLDIVIPGFGRPTAPLATQERVVSGETIYMISTLPMKLRVDSVPGHNEEIQVRQAASTPGATGSLIVGIYGYLVDI